MEIRYGWTDGSNPAFQNFYKITEEYYSQIAGGLENRKTFVPFNVLNDIKDVLIAYDYDRDKTPVACAAFRLHSETDAEIKRVWVEPSYRREHIAKKMMEELEYKMAEKGFKRAILQTREIMSDAVSLYIGLGYSRINNYPPYDKMDGAICFAKYLVSG